MNTAMKILLIGDFRRDRPNALWSNMRKFSKGFQRCGHDVMEFSYPHILQQYSRFNSRKLALRLYKAKTDQALATLATHYQPDLVVLMAYKLLDAATIQLLRTTLPRAVFLFRYSDALYIHDHQILPIARLCDWFIPSGAGKALEHYKNKGILRSAFLPNPSDPDVEYPSPVDSQWHSTLLFTGKLSHNLPNQDTSRAKLVQQLVDRYGMTIWGCLSRPSLIGRDYLNAIRGAEIALSINAYNAVSKYHSDRLSHLTSCGAFTLARRVPDSETLFQDNKHLCYFETPEECFSLYERFSRDESARKVIARAGMEHCHREYNAQRLAQCLVDLAVQGEFKADWAEFLV